MNIDRCRNCFFLMILMVLLNLQRNLSICWLISRRKFVGFGRGEIRNETCFVQGETFGRGWSEKTLF